MLVDGKKSVRRWLSMQRTKEDIYALINKSETFHLECKKA